MFRGSQQRLVRCFQGFFRSGTNAVQGVSPAAAAASPCSKLGSLFAEAHSLHSSRSYSVGLSYWDHGQTRRDQYLDIETARNMLPHRSKFIPEFTPHGFQLIPHHKFAEAAEDITPLQCDSVKRKRRLKMKRHKYKKRMRALKAGNK